MDHQPTQCNEDLSKGDGLQLTADLWNTALKTCFDKFEKNCPLLARKNWTGFVDAIYQDHDYSCLAKDACAANAFEACNMSNTFDDWIDLKTAFVKFMQETAWHRVEYVHYSTCVSGDSVAQTHALGCDPSALALAQTIFNKNCLG